MRVCIVSFFHQSKVKYLTVDTNQLCTEWVDEEEEEEEVGDAMWKPVSDEDDDDDLLDNVAAAAAEGAYKFDVRMQ